MSKFVDKLKDLDWAFYAMLSGVLLSLHFVAYLHGIIFSKIIFEDLIFHKVFHVSLALVFLIPVPVLFRCKFGGLYGILVYTILFFILLLEIGSLFLYGKSVSYLIISSIFMSSFGEVWEFLYTNKSWWYALFIPFFVPFYYIVKKVLTNKVYIRLSSVVATLFVLFVSISTLRNSPNLVADMSENKELAPVYAFYDASVKYSEHLYLLEDAKRMFVGKNSFEVEDHFKHVDYPKVYFLIIGESAGKHHHQIYSYHRETNPLLSKRSDLTWYENVISPSSYTIYSVPQLLTFGNSQDEYATYVLPSIIDVFNRAGFETHWISNQRYFGNWDTPITAIASRAKHQKFVHGVSRRSYDERLLEELKKTTQSASDKFIVLHLIGSHGSYKQRYPVNWKHFDDTDLPKHEWMSSNCKNWVNTYDDSIRYTDWVLNEVLNHFDRLGNFSFGVYLPDHGEEVCDFREYSGHAQEINSRYMFEVPFFVWQSKKFSEEKSNDAVNLEEHTHRYYNSENLVHTFLDLAGIKTKFNKDELSLTSDAYQEQPTYRRHYKFGSGARKKLTQNVDVKFDAKAWKHRVNSLKSLDAAKDSFKGIEIDVVFDTNLGCFDVRHPPNKSKGLCLRHYFDHLKSPGEFYYWLDFKNLSSKNEKESLKTLIEYSQRFGVPRKNIIVESRSPQSLTSFYHEGFLTSYYLPTIKVNIPVWKQYKKEAVIRKKARGAKFHFISQTLGMKPLLEKHFPESNYLFWFLRKDLSDKRKYKMLKNGLNDKKVYVVLVSYADGKGLY